MRPSATPPLCVPLMFLSAALLLVPAAMASENPVAVRDEVNLEELGPMEILVDVLANDSSPVGDPLRIVIVEHPEVGELLGLERWDGSLTYRLDFTPADHSYVLFEYLVEDSSGRRSQPVFVCIGVCQVDLRVPVAQDDGPIPVEVGKAVFVEPLVNDEGDGIFIDDFSNPTSGSLSFDQARQRFHYTAPGQPGTASFIYTIRDIHGDETTGSVFFEIFQGEQGVVMAEVGVRHGVDHSGLTVFLQHQFQQPVVIAQPATPNGPIMATVQIYDVQPTFFRMRIDQAPCRDTDLGIHPAETVAYLVVEAGSWDLAGGQRIEAGRVETGTTVAGAGGPFGSPSFHSICGSLGAPSPCWDVNGAARNVWFAGSFEEEPVVMAQLQTRREEFTVEPSYAVTRQLTPDGADAQRFFSLALQKEERSQLAGIPHEAQEHVGWVAISSGVDDWSGRRFEAGILDFCENICDIHFQDIRTPFSSGDGFTSPPLVMTALASLDDTEPANLRRNFLDQDRLGLTVFEDASEDGGPEEGPLCYDGEYRKDQYHGPERVSYLAIEGAGILHGTSRNRPPVAHDIHVVTAQDTTVNIYAPGEDPDGSPLTFYSLDTEGLEGNPGWELQLAFAEFTPASGFWGTTEFFATVRDELGTGLESNNFARITIDVTPFETSMTASCQGRTCTFSSVSSPEAETLVWDFDDGSGPLFGSVAQVQEVTHTYQQGGIYQPRITAINHVGNEASDSEIVQLRPTARIDLSCNDATRECQFDGSSSTDDVSEYHWVFGDGVTSSLVAPIHTYQVGGRYLVTLSVSNDDELADISGRLVDLPPTAAFELVGGDCGPDRTCTFDAGSSTSDASEFEWDFGDGSTGSGQIVTHTFDQGGSFTVTLTASNTVKSHTASKTFGLPPTAAATVVSCDENRLCHFDAGASSADASTFEWQFGDGGSGIGKTMSHLYTQGGAFTVTLTATNAVPLSASTTVTVSLPPTAGFTWTCEGGVCSFDATSSSNDAETFTWQIDGVDDLQGPQVTHTFVDSGFHTVTLTVTNAIELSHSVSQQVEVDLLPIAAFTFSCNSLGCTFDASGSSDDHGIAAYSWAFGDGGVATGRIVAHELAEEGSYLVRLTVVDTQQQTAVAEREVTVDDEETELILLIWSDE